MPISDRLNNWVEDRRKTWGGALGDFLLNSMANGLYKGLEKMEPGALDAIKNNLIALRDNPNTPDDLKAVIDKVMTPGNPLLIVVGVLFIVISSFGVINALCAPLNRAIEYKVDRGIESYRMDPMSIITAWRRDPAKYSWLIDDLDEQGWSENKIEALKFLTQVIPNAADIVRFALREVYSPEIAKQYGQFEDIPTDAYTDAAKAGLSTDMFDKYWAAHWALPSASDGFEMLHRGILTEDQLRGLLKASDVMPYWREQLIKLSWNLPTRVDIRRFWEMRTIDEKRLREVYTALGYHGQDLEDYVLWTKIYVDFPDLITRFKNGWLSLDDLRSELLKLGLSAERAEELIQTKVKAAASEKVAKDKDLTAAEIVKGVKKGVITQAEGLELLQELGYDEWEAEFKLAIEVAVATGSPENYDEFKSLTDKFRLAVSLPKSPMTDELKRLGADVVRLQGEVDTLNKSIKTEQGTLAETEGLPAEATAHLRELQQSLYRAQAELTRVKTDYNAKITEWRRAVR